MTDSPLPGATPLPEVVRRRVDAAVAARGAQDVAARAHHRDADGRPRFSNRLALESSPYLLQHAHNPVNWFPWGEEAFAEAARLARPIFLSVGYSTCHWCHVMERESFEDEEIAAFMNEHYVAIKVDREERPDVDAVYMSAVQQLTGSGGWPMSVWLTPAREPFFGGTYFPPRTGVRGSRHGFLALLGDLADTYRREPERVTHAAHSLVEAVRRDMEGARDEVEEGEEGGVVPGRQAIDQAVAYCKRSFDSVHGGLRRSPKFPSNVPLRLLLRHYHRTHDLEALQVALLTLEKMAGGGIYDQLGGGFHRYSTDGEWLVPHFEKMLYDNALLVVAYAEAFQLTGQAHLSRIVRETCDYVLREMTASDGGFYAATDADSEGHEGKFFVWSADEIRSVLTAAGRADDIEAFFQHYDVTAAGNWDGSTILRVRRPDEAMWARLTEARAVLYRHRAQRVPPLRDEKILSAWNGLMISALAIAGRILDEPRYRDAARRAAEFVLTRLHDDADGPARVPRRLRLRRRGPHRAVPGHLRITLSRRSLAPRRGDRATVCGSPRWLVHDRLRSRDPHRAGAADSGWGRTLGLLRGADERAAARRLHRRPQMARHRRARISLLRDDTRRSVHGDDRGAAGARRLLERVPRDRAGLARGRLTDRRRAVPVGAAPDLSACLEHRRGDTPRAGLTVRDGAVRPRKDRTRWSHHRLRVPSWRV
jgi:hypothetical protein